MNKLHIELLYHVHSSLITGKSPKVYNSGSDVDNIPKGYWSS